MPRSMLPGGRAVKLGFATLWSWNTPGSSVPYSSARSEWVDMSCNGSGIEKKMLLLS